VKIRGWKGERDKKRERERETVGTEEKRRDDCLLGSLL
jgi:hypothetical protein